MDAKPTIQLGAPGGDYSYVAKKKEAPPAYQGHEYGRTVRDGSPTERFGSTQGQDQQHITRDPKQAGSTRCDWKQTLGVVIGVAGTLLALFGVLCLTEIFTMALLGGVIGASVTTGVGLLAIVLGTAIYCKVRCFADNPKSRPNDHIVRSSSRDEVLRFDKPIGGGSNRENDL